MAEWRVLMQARARAGVPLVVGTAGTCGTDSTVDWMFDITRDLARDLGQSVKVARVYSEQDGAELAEALDAGKVTPLWPELPISADLLADCAHIVALAGAEAIAAALVTGADIVIAGRATDTASIAALPLMRGEHAGAAWHGAKIGECGALCTTNPTSGVIVIDFDDSGFTVRPMADGARATPDLVAAHMLYENADPNILHEPGGHLDVSEAVYVQADETGVRVTGSRWVASDDYTVKLEGARLLGHQACSLALLRERRYVEQAQAWCARLESYLAAEIEGRMGLKSGDYAMEFRRIGQDATLGALERAPSAPCEVGVLAIFTAADRDTALGLAKLANPFLLHYPLCDDEPQATFAFSFSPVEWDRGPLHEFCLNHVLHVVDPMAQFRLEVDDV